MPGIQLEYGGFSVMVVRRGPEKESEDKSNQNTSSDSEEEDLDYLIDGLLGNLSVCPPNNQIMTIKNRKERPKHERSDRVSSVDASSASHGESSSFGIRRHGTGSRGQITSRNRNRVARQNQYQLNQYSGAPNNLRSQPPSNRQWLGSHDIPKNVLERRVECPEISEAGTGNNSEDEYSRMSENASPNASKVCHCVNVL